MADSEFQPIASILKGSAYAVPSGSNPAGSLTTKPGTATFVSNDKTPPSSEKVKSPTQQITLNTIGTYPGSFLKSIEDIGKSLDSVDCTDKLKKGIDTLLGGSKFTSALDVVNNFTKKTSVDGLLNLATEFTKTNKITSGAVDGICRTLQPVITQIIQIIESMLTLATRLFKQIDKYRKKLEAAIKFFLREIVGCIKKVISDIELYIATIAGNITNMDALIKLLDSPCGGCIRDMVLKMFPKSCRRLCESAVSGSALVECLKTQVAIKLGVDNLIPTINQYIQEYFTKYLDKAFDILEKIVRDILDSFMKPLRWAIRAYCRFLNAPIPNPLLGCKYCLPECLFVYTKTKKGKVTIYTTSVIQYIETLKLWASCFNSACDLLSGDDVKRQIKKFNEGFRLDSKYWLGGDGSELDIYFACMESNANSKDSSFKKALWTSVKKNTFVDTWDFIKKSMTDLSREEFVPKNRNSVNCFDPETPADATETVDGGSSSSSISAEIENIKSLHGSINIINGSDGEEFPLNQGRLKFYSKFVEESITRTAQNIGGVINYHNWYARLNEMMQWLGQYNKSQTLLNTLTSAKNRYGAATDSSISQETNDFLSVLPTYIIRNDYSTLNTIPQPDKLPTESMLDYYARWYGETVKQDSIA